MSERHWTGGRIARLGSGRYKGMFVQVEADPSGGFHIWLFERHPDDGPSAGWDIWADTADDVEDWFSDELSSVTWSDADER